MSMESHGTANRWTERRARKALLVPAVVMALMMAAAPAGASCLNDPISIAKSARTAAIAKELGHARGHRHQGWMEFLRKVG
jgi:hypothetical protein